MSVGALGTLCFLDAEAFAATERSSFTIVPAVGV